MSQPGMIALFGSGETAPSGRKVHEYLLGRLSGPVRIAILDTPAGFQPNVELVAGKIKSFFEQHLRNFRPDVTIVRARAKGSGSDPDDPALVDVLLEANYIVAGPGSPSYAIRHLRGTRALGNIARRNETGAILALASAAAIASGALALPVYEIFKAGAELHWLPGLDLFARHGLKLAILTHWNNREGGADLDTSRCYMGMERFERLRALLPVGTVVMGIDEHTACIFDFLSRRCHVLGLGTVTVLTGEETLVFAHDSSFPISALEAPGPALSASVRS